MGDGTARRTVLEDESVAVAATLPWAADDPAPLALVSFSTGFEQRNLDKLQHTLDALGTLDVHVVATTGGIVDPAELRVPGNAALIVTHGGHGTAMRSLRNGVPMVIIPGLAGD
jgi:UDP:flavonoid glycosyltransferase YjiC (YdhE family)